MRITKISVSRLFGQYDHTIPLNQEDRITIIHGPNGVGKTILLKMIQGLFQPRFAVFRTTPFGSFRVDFDDGRYLVVRRGRVARRTDAAPVARADDDPDDGYDDCITVLGPEDGQRWDSTGSGGTEEETALARDEIAKTLPQLRSQDGVRWEDWIDGGDMLTLQDAYEKYEMRLKNRFPGWYAPWLREIHEQRLTFMLDTDRIEPAKRVLGGHAVYRNPSTSMPDIPVTPLDWCAGFVAQEMKEAREAALNTMMDLEMSFRDRVLDRLLVADDAAPTSADLHKQVSGLQSLRSRLIDAGLLDEGDDTDIPSELELADADRKLIGLLLEDKLARFAELEPLLPKIELFRRIINDRLSRSSKRLADDLNEALRIETPNGQIEPAALSSGEKQYLVLFLNLLFNYVLRPGTLVLIDEPELSMHIAWQQKFLKDLGAVAKLADLDFLIATHSPDIIYDRWDLTVDLGGGGADADGH